MQRPSRRDQSLSVPQFGKCAGYLPGQIAGSELSNYSAERDFELPKTARVGRFADK